MINQSVHPALDAKDVPVFDASKAGVRVRAERFDEPGHENFPNGKVNESAKNHGILAALLTIDIQGDWSWKPGRDRMLGKHMVTFRGVPPSAAELYRNRMHQPG